jgi:AraC-like DNA-binding protein
MGLVIDTSTVAPHERLELWSSTTSELFFPTEVRCVDGSAFTGVMARYALGPLDVFRVRGSALVLDRTPRGVRDADPEFFALSMLRSGRLSHRQEDRRSEVGPGVMSAYDSSRPFRIRADAAFEQVVVTVPKPLLRPSPDRIARLTASPVQLAAGAGGLAGAMLLALLRELEDGSIRADDAELAEGIVAMLRGLYAGTPEPPGRPPSVQMRAIKDHIDAHLADRDLGPDSIARAHFVSTRYLHLLFEREGVSVSRWIRSRRLERARRDLQDPALAHEPVMRIAARWGFSSASHFSNLVRAEYGCSPRELRG